MGINAKESLKEIFTIAQERPDMNFVFVVVRMDEFEGKETIINPRENFQSKLEYYDRAYDDDLRLKANSGIRITGYGYAETFEAINYYVNGGKSEVSLVYSIASGHIEGVEKVFHRRSDADAYAKKNNGKGFVSNYVETYEVVPPYTISIT